MVKTEGSDSKKRKKLVDETVDAGVLHAQQNVRVTRSKASMNEDQLERCLTAIRRRQTLKSVPVDVAADDDITKGTKGVSSVTPKASITPKLTAPKRCIQRDVANSPNRDKQPNHERVDENVNNGDQGSCPSSESSRTSNPSKQKKDNEEFDRRLLRLFEEDGDGLQPRQTLPSSTTHNNLSKQKKAVEEFERHLMRLCEEDGDGLQPRQLTLPSSTTHSNPSKQKKDVEEFEKRLKRLCEEDGDGLQPKQLTLPSSTTHSNPSKQKKDVEEFERRLLRLCEEDGDGLQPRQLPLPSSFTHSNPSKQKKDIEELERRLLRLCEKDGDGLQPRQSTLPSSATQHVETVLPSKVGKIGLAKAHSFNLTAMMEDHGSPNDDGEAISSIDPGLTYVKGYYVKTELAPTLEQILEKYPDTARGCIFQTPKMAALMLETLCSLYQKFKNTGLKNIRERELEHLTSFVENFHQMGYDVSWIIERLKDVSEMKRIMTDYPTLKDEKLKTQMKEEEVDMLKREMDTLKQKLSVAEAELMMMKAAEDGERYRIFHQQIDVFKAKGLACWDTSVFYGLL